MPALKFYHNNEIHKCHKLPTDYVALKNSIESIFTLKSNLYQLQYEDCEGDKIMITGQQDYQAMLETEANSKTIKIYITITSQPASVENIQNLNKNEVYSIVVNEPQPISKEQVVEVKKVDKEEVKQPVEEIKVVEKKEVVEPKKGVHQFVTCDGCRMSPIVGTRFKCTVCNNFDYCENCEATREHIHSFVKMNMKNSQVQDQIKIQVTENKKIEAPLENKLLPVQQQPVALKLLSAELSQLTKVANQVQQPFVKKNLWRTITIKNNGILDFPKGATLQSYKNSVQSVNLPALKVNESFMVSVKVCDANNNNLKGKYETEFVVKANNLENVEEVIGKFVVNYEVVEEPKYSTEIMNKAETLYNLFPQRTLDFYCQSVQDNTKLTIEELVENFYTLKN